MVLLMFSHESRFWLANVLGLGREPIAVKLDWTAEQGLKILELCFLDCLLMIKKWLEHIFKLMAAF